MERAQRFLERFGRWRYAALMLLAIFGLSSVPNYVVVTEPSRWPADKAVHFGEYAVLAAVFVGAASRERRSGGWLVAVAGAAILLSALYGASDELHQRFVRGRDPDMQDWMADVLGATAGAVVAAMLLRAREDERP